MNLTLSLIHDLVIQDTQCGERKSYQKHTNQFTRKFNFNL